jgi:putative ABC transport system permease protein
MAVCIRSSVRFELSYDDFHRQAENIYRVATKVTLQGEVINHETNTYEGISKALVQDFPEVKAATSIRSFNSDGNFIWYEDDDKKLVPLQAFKAFDVDFYRFTFQLLEKHTGCFTDPILP